MPCRKSLSYAVTPQLRAFTIPSFFIMNTSAPAPSGCCVASYSSFQRQLGSLAPLHTWAGMPVRGWCFHSTLCWSLPLYLAHFNKIICLPTVFPHQYTNIHPLLCRQVAQSLCLAEQSIPANPHNSCFSPTHWQFPSVPSSDGHHRSSNGKTKTWGLFGIFWFLSLDSTQAYQPNL